MGSVCVIPRINDKEQYVKDALIEVYDIFINKYKGKKKFAQFLKKRGFFLNLQKSYRKEFKDELQAYVIKEVTNTWLNDNKIKGSFDKMLATIQTQCCQHYQMRYGNPDIFYGLSGLYNETMLKFKQEYVKSFFIDINDDTDEAYVTNGTTTENRIHRHKKQLVKNIISYNSNLTDEELEEQAELILSNAEEYEKFMNSKEVIDIINKWYPASKDPNKLSLGTTSTDEKIKPLLEKAKLAYTSLYVLNNYDQLLNDVSGQKFKFKIDNTSYNGKFAVKRQGKYAKERQEGSSNFTREEVPDAEKNIDVDVKTILSTIPRHNSIDQYLIVDDLKSLSSIVFSYYNDNKEQFGNIYENPETVILNILKDSEFLNKEKTGKFENTILSFKDYFDKIEEINIRVYQKQTNLENDVLQKICHELINIKALQYIEYSKNDVKTLYFAEVNSKVNNIIQSIEDTLYTIIKSNKKDKNKDKFLEDFINSNDDPKQLILDLLGKVGLSEITINSFKDTIKNNDKFSQNVYNKLKSILDKASKLTEVIKIKESIHNALLPSEGNYGSYDKSNPIYKLSEILAKNEAEKPITQISGADPNTKRPTYSYGSPLEDFSRLLTHEQNKQFTKNLFKRFPQLLKTSNESSFTIAFATATEFVNEDNFVEIKDLNVGELLVNDFDGNFLKLGKQGQFATRIGENADKGRQLLMMINTRAKISNNEIQNLIDEVLPEESEEKLEIADYFKGTEYTIETMTETQLFALAYLTQKAYYNEVEKDITDTMSEVINNHEVSNEEDNMISYDEYNSINCNVLSITDQLTAELQPLASLNNDEAMKKCK